MKDQEEMVNGPEPMKCNNPHCLGCYPEGDVVVVRREDLKEVIEIAEREICFRNFSSHRRFKKALNEFPSPPRDPDHQPEKG